MKRIQKYKGSQLDYKCILYNLSTIPGKAVRYIKRVNMLLI
jgi:hypothetical protein